MRLFAALPLPSEALRRLASVAEGLKSSYPDLKVVKPEGLHVTLVFLGERTEAEAAELERIIDDPALAVPCISASMGGYGQFPPRGNPRVVFCPLHEGAEEVAAVFRTLVGLISRSGGIRLEEEARGFSAHITLARNKGARMDSGKVRALFDFEDRFVLDRLVLFQSLLKPDGAEYRPVKTVQFRQAGG